MKRNKFTTWKKRIVAFVMLFVIVVGVSGELVHAQEVDWQNIQRYINSVRRDPVLFNDDDLRASAGVPWDQIPQEQQIAIRSAAQQTVSGNNSLASRALRWFDDVVTLGFDAAPDWVEDYAENPQETAENAAKAAINTIVKAIVNIPQSLAAFVVTAAMMLEGAVLILLTKILIILTQYNGFVQAEVVQNGWRVVRDITNLFFVLIILAIAIGTILRIESYNFKKALPRVILMAVLVNFSLLIAGVIIDFSQVIMLTFVAAFAATAGSNLITALHIDAILNTGVSRFSGIVSDTSNSPEPLSFLSVVVTGIFGIILLFVAIVAVGVTLLVLLGRMVMLWLLLVLSPLPYLLSAFPQGQRYAQQWWQEFTKYVVYGPAIGFFLWLSLSVVSGQEGISGDAIGDDRLVTQLNQAGQQTGAIFTDIGGVQNLFSFMIAIALLMAGLLVTQQLGVAGSGFAGNAFSGLKQRGLSPLFKAGGFGKWAGGALAKAPFQYIARKSNEAVAEQRGGIIGTTLRAGNIASALRGYQARRDQIYGSARERATARGQDFVEKVFVGTDQGRAAQAQLKQEAEYAKDFSSVLDKEEFAQKAVELTQGRDSAEKRSKRRALIRAAAEQGYLDDIMGHKDMKKYVKDAAQEMYDNGPQELKDYMDAPDEVSGKSLRERMAEGEWNGYDQTHMFLQKYIGDTQEGLNTINGLEEVAVRTRHPEYSGHATFNPDTGQMEMETLYDQKNADGEVVRKSAQSRAIGEYLKWPGRSKMTVAPHGTYTFGTDSDGKSYIGQDSFGRAIAFGAFAGQAQRSVEHSQPRHWPMIVGGTGDDVRWARNDAGEVIRAENNNRIPEITRPETMQALANHLHNVGGTGQNWGGNALWSTLGNKEGTPRVMYNGQEVSFEDIANSNPSQWSQGAGVPQPGGPAPAGARIDASAMAQVKGDQEAEEASGSLGGVRGAMTASAKKKGDLQAGIGVDLTDQSVREKLGITREDQAGAYYIGEDKNKAADAIGDIYNEQLTQERERAQQTFEDSMQGSGVQEARRQIIDERATPAFNQLRQDIMDDKSISSEKRDAQLAEADNEFINRQGITQEDIQKKVDANQENAWHRAYEELQKSNPNSAYQIKKSARDAYEETEGKGSFDKLSSEDQKRAIGRATQYFASNEELQNKRVSDLKTGLKNAETIRLRQNGLSGGIADREELAHAKVEKMSDKQRQRVLGTLTKEQASAMDAELDSEYQNLVIKNSDSDEVKATKQKLREQEKLAKIIGVGTGAYQATDKTRRALDSVGKNLGVSLRPRNAQAYQPKFLDRFGVPAAVTRAIGTKSKKAADDMAKGMKDAGVDITKELGRGAKDFMASLEGIASVPLDNIRGIKPVRQAYDNYKKIHTAREETKDLVEGIPESRKALVTKRDGLQKQLSTAQSQGKVRDAARISGELRKVEKGIKGLDKMSASIEKSYAKQEKKAAKQFTAAAKRASKQGVSPEEQAMIDEIGKAEGTKTSSTSTAASQATSQAPTPQQLEEHRETIEVIEGGTDAAEVQGEGLQAAVDSADATMITGALMDLERTLGSVQSAIQGMPKSLLNESAVNKLNQSLKEVRGHRLSNGSALDSTSTKGLLANINYGLRQIGKKLGKNETGPAPTSIEPPNDES